jgi:chitin disaccharide deacetylase
MGFRLKEQALPNQPIQRKLLVIADDFGMGPNTSRGILELAQRKLVTGSVLLVNTTYAQEAVASWRRAGQPMDMGWHPNLTLDAPILPAGKVPSLTTRDGTFWPLGKFMARLFTGRINAAEVGAELEAQLKLYIDLVGAPPTHVNSHQHLSVFAPIHDCLLDLLLREGMHPYIRRVREPWNLVMKIEGARKKRAFLNYFGRATARELDLYGFPGNDWLAGVTDPPWLKRGEYYEDWLKAIPGNVVELSCHPGHLDETLLGRDCFPNDGYLERRVSEYNLLTRPEFPRAIAEAGFTLISPTQLTGEPLRHAA